MLTNALRIRIERVLRMYYVYVCYIILRSSVSQVDAGFVIV